MEGFGAAQTIPICVEDIVAAGAVAVMATIAALSGLMQGREVGSY